MSRSSFLRYSFLMSFGVVVSGLAVALDPNAANLGIENGHFDLVGFAPQSADLDGIFDPSVAQIDRELRGGGAENSVARDAILPDQFAALLLAAATTAGPSARGAFVMTSTDLHAGHPIASTQVYGGMGCDGQNQSPELSWTGVPEGTKTFAITMYDPDAPTGSGWWHWVVFNIPADVTSLPAGAGDSSRNLLPPGATLGNTDFGTPGYGGPCPPEGDKAHRYMVTVYALDDTLSIPGNATAAYVGFNIHAHTIGKATLSALYGR